MDSLQPSTSSRQAPVFELQGGRFTFSQPGKGTNGGGARRGEVKALSNASRRRLMAKFASLAWSDLATAKTPIWFMTLTTPEDLWSRPGYVYRGLRRFRDNLEYAHGGEGGYLGAIVRREHGAKRGMLHYHLIVIGGTYTKREIQGLWTAALRCGSSVRVDVQPLESAERVAKYLSKYCSKAGYEGAPGEDVQRPQPGGAEGHELPLSVQGAAAPLSKAHNVGSTYSGKRWWYVWGMQTLPWGELIAFDVENPRKFAARVKRIYRRWRVDKERQRLSRASFPRLVECMSVAQVESLMPFNCRLRRFGGGYTLLVSPDVLEKFIDAAAIAAL